MAFSYFFRDIQSLEKTVKYLVPQFIGRSKVRIWDAGCAMGQESYSLAILFAENMGYFGFQNIHILATDIEGDFREIVNAGVYQTKTVERLPERILKKYFRPAAIPGHYQIIEEIRTRVEFKKHNLLSLRPVSEGFSLIVCKNVLLHFKEKERVDVIKMFHMSLAPDSYFLTEQTQKLPSGTGRLFERVVPEAQLFRKIEKIELPMAYAS